MLDAEASKVDLDAPVAPETVPVGTQLATMVTVIEAAVRAKEPRAPFHRVLRQLASIRKRLTPAETRAFVTKYIPASNPSYPALIAGVESVRNCSVLERGRCRECWRVYVCFVPEARSEWP